jgi:type I restriction-modification system DNA methylase subunit
MIHQIAENLRHKDGMISGIKWSKEETSSVAKQYDAKTKVEAAGCRYNCTHFWLAMNYVYAVHHSNSRTINGYVDLAIDELCNKNICFEHLIKKIFEKM